MDCASGDTCCPAGCSRATDSDCPAVDLACETCEGLPRQNADFCSQELARCDRNQFTTVPNSAGLCRAELDCIHRTKCARNAVSDCLCGVDADPYDCFTGAAPFGGICKAEIIAAAGSDDPAELSTRFFDPEYPSGAADQVIEACDDFYCPMCVL